MSKVGSVANLAHMAIVDYAFRRRPGVEGRGFPLLIRHHKD